METKVNLSWGKNKDIGCVCMSKMTDSRFLRSTATRYQRDRPESWSIGWKCWVWAFRNLQLSGAHNHSHVIICVNWTIDTYILPFDYPKCGSGDQYIGYIGPFGLFNGANNLIASTSRLVKVTFVPGQCCFFSFLFQAVQCCLKYPNACVCKIEITNVFFCALTFVEARQKILKVLKHHVSKRLSLLEQFMHTSGKPVRTIVDCVFSVLAVKSKNSVLQNNLCTMEDALMFLLYWCM